MLDIEKQLGNAVKRHQTFNQRFFEYKSFFTKSQCGINRLKIGTFNIAAEIARLVKRSTFATAKDRIFIVPFLGSRNGVNSAYS